MEKELKMTFNVDDIIKEAQSKRVRAVAMIKQGLEGKPYQNTNSLNLPSESFILNYNNPQHGEFFRELISKVNSTYSGTKAEISETAGEVQGNIIKRAGIISTIANDPNLRSANLWPITPKQSEYLLQAGKLPSPEDYWEDLALVLYDTSSTGINSKEAKAIHDSLKANRQELNLSSSDLENKLIIVNPGLEVDSSMPYGVKPLVIPGITHAYRHEVLEKVGEDPSFNGYGLNGGLPLLNQLGSGSRTLYMPDETENIGLRALYRYWGSYLNAGLRYLDDVDGVGRITFSSENSQK